MNVLICISFAYELQVEPFGRLVQERTGQRFGERGGDVDHDAGSQPEERIRTGIFRRQLSARVGLPGHVDAFQDEPDAQVERPAATAAPSAELRRIIRQEPDRLQSGADHFDQNPHQIDDGHLEERAETFQGFRAG